MIRCYYTGKSWIKRVERYSQRMLPLLDFTEKINDKFTQPRSETNKEFRNEKAIVNEWS